MVNSVGDQIDDHKCTDQGKIHHITTHIINASPSEPVLKVDVHGLHNCVAIMTFTISVTSSFITSVRDVLIKRILSMLSSKPGLLVPSERYVRRNSGGRVHKD